MKKLLQVRGDCLEGIGVWAPRTMIRDTSLEVRVGDLVHCSRNTNFLDTYVKQVLSIDPEGGMVVGTRYVDPTRDFTFVPEKVYGVVTEIYNGDGNLVYERKA